ncbi:GFA family protein [Mesorhizobium sp. RCC_202]|uniref:GFA family protein n=1 Tax=Mesorhizobium sp. RCC_202 TaxID=3239222 RepID=UPI0035251A40
MPVDKKRGERGNMLKTYAGSCHCGKVRFEADIDLAQGTVKCNCSTCTKTRSWIGLVGPQHYRLLSGAEAQTEYQWIPPGQERSTIEYHFCATCGTRMPARGDIPMLGGIVIAIPIAALDGVDPDELAAAPVMYADGRHDRFDRTPDDIRTM